MGAVQIPVTSSPASAVFVPEIPYNIGYTDIGISATPSNNVDWTPISASSASALLKGAMALFEPTSTSTEADLVEKHYVSTTFGDRYSSTGDSSSSGDGSNSSSNDPNSTNILSLLSRIATSLEKGLSGSSNVTSTNISGDTKTYNYGSASEGALTDTAFIAGVQGLVSAIAGMTLSLADSFNRLQEKINPNPELWSDFLTNFNTLNEFKTTASSFTDLLGNDVQHISPMELQVKKDLALAKTHSDENSTTLDDIDTSDLFDDDTLLTEAMKLFKFNGIVDNLTDIATNLGSNGLIDGYIPNLDLKE